MSKLIDDPLKEVEVDRAGRPRSFRWRGGLLRVARTAEVWKDVGCWWEGEGEKVFYRLETTDGRLLEVYLERPAGIWRLYRVYD